MLKAARLHTILPNGCGGRLHGEIFCTAKLSGQRSDDLCSPSSKLVRQHCREFKPRILHLVLCQRSGSPTGNVCFCRLERLLAKARTSVNLEDKRIVTKIRA